MTVIGNHPQPGWPINPGSRIDRIDEAGPQ